MEETTDRDEKKQRQRVGAGGPFQAVTKRGPGPREGCHWRAPSWVRPQAALEIWGREGDLGEAVGVRHWSSPTEPPVARQLPASAPWWS